MVLPVDMKHGEINQELGLPSDYTNTVESFIRSLGLTGGMIKDIKPQNPLPTECFLDLLVDRALYSSYLKYEIRTVLRASGDLATQTIFLQDTIFLWIYHQLNLTQKTNASFTQSTVSFHSLYPERFLV